MSRLAFLDAMWTMASAFQVGDRHADRNNACEASKPMPKQLIAPAVSAEKPATGLSLVRRAPVVCTILQPPVSVPTPMAAWQLRTTHSEIFFPAVAFRLGATNTAAMTPMVFWASAPP